MRLAAGVKLATVAWGFSLNAGGVAILSGWIPGTMATGPRIGVGLLLVMVGVLVLAFPLSVWFVGRFARPEGGRCPVGEPCGGCGAFNLKPRRACRLCSHPVNRDAS